jgi:hypothetical protein
MFGLGEVDQLAHCCKSVFGLSAVGQVPAAGSEAAGLEDVVSDQDHPINGEPI